MKHSILLMLLLSSRVTGVHAQSLERQVIGTAGTFQNAAWGSLSSTTGESVTNTLSTSSVVLTQGFQQPTPADLSVSDPEANDNFIKVYPNPATNDLNVLIIAGPGAHHSVSLFDLPGQQLQVPCRKLNTGSGSLQIFDIHTLPDGTYLLLINDQQGHRVKTIKFTKLN